MDELLDSWMDVGPTVAPERIASVASTQIRATPQRRASRLARMFSDLTVATRRMPWTMNRTARLGLVLIALLVLASIGIAVAGALLRKPAPSGPAGGWVAFATVEGFARGGPGVIYLAREDGDPQLAIGVPGDGIRRVCPSFSPDGSHLAYAEASEPLGRQGEYANRAVVVVSLDAAGAVTGPEVRIPTNQTGGTDPCPEWSADGESIAFPMSPGGLGIARLSGDSVVVPSWGDQFTQVNDFKWAPDRNVIAATRVTGVWLVPADGGAPQLLLPSTPGGGFEGVTWAPDGTRLAVAESLATAGDSASPSFVRVLSANGRGEPVVLGEGAAPLWSPPGDLIAFGPFEAGQPADVFVFAEPDGRESRVVSEVTIDGTSWTPAGGLIWSPDGARFVFVGFNAEATEYALVSVSTAGDAPPVLLTEPSLDLYNSSADSLSWQPVHPE